MLAWVFDITSSGIQRTDKPDEENGIAPAAEAVNKSPSIAVLPFPDFSAERDQEHDRAITLFKKAVELDPGFVRAWIELADVSASQALFHGGGDEARRIAEEVANQAVSLAPERAGSYLARGLSHLAKLEYSEAERDFLKAIEINPGHHGTYHNAGRTAHLQGRLDQACIYFAKATELDPDDTSTRYNVACFYATIGETEKLLDLLENSISSRSWIENDSELDSLRDHPRYKAIVESMPE